VSKEQQRILIDWNCGAFIEADTMKYRKYAYITVFLCVCSFGLGQDESRDTKQHPELSKV